MTRNLKFILAVGAAAALLLAGAFSVMDRAEKAREDVMDWRTVNALAMSRGPSAAEAALDARLVSHPNDAMLHYYRARLHFELGRADKALAEADRAIALGYAQEISHVLKGLVYGRLLGDRRAQERLASKALTFDPTYDEAYLVRAEARYALGDYRGCAADAASFSGLKPAEPDGYEYTLLCRGELGEFGAAEAAGLKLAVLEPESHAARWRLGRLYARRGFHRRAVKEFSEAIRLSSGRPSYYLDRAASCEALGDLNCSAWDYYSAMDWQQVSGYASYYYLLGSSMYRAGETQRALDAAGEALKLDPAGARGYLLRGRLRAEGGDRAGARADLLKASALSPSLSSEAADALSRLDAGR